MSDKNIVEFCAPTLAGIKTANLFTCDYHSKTQVREDIRRINRVLVKKGIKVLPVRYSNHRVLIYVYRPSFLEKDLCDKDTVNMLSGMGYKVGNVHACIDCLRKKLNEFTDNKHFPHEIGLFLGYPPEDVKGFIDNKGECSKCVGCWKVYGDEKKACDTFAKYKKCTADYMRRFSLGAGLDNLAVVI